MVETISFLHQNNKVQGLLELARPIKSGKLFLEANWCPNCSRSIGKSWPLPTHPVQNPITKHRLVS